jgi:hypothetical protein
LNPDVYQFEGMNLLSNYYEPDVLVTSLRCSSCEKWSFCIQVRHSNNYAVFIDAQRNIARPATFFLTIFYSYAINWESLLTLIANHYIAVLSVAKVFVEAIVTCVSSKMDFSITSLDKEISNIHSFGIICVPSSSGTLSCGVGLVVGLSCGVGLVVGLSCGVGLVVGLSCGVGLVVGVSCGSGLVEVSLNIES